MRKKILLSLIALSTIASAAKINKIEIQNLKELPEQLVSDLIPAQEGMEYSNKLLSDIYVNLTRTNLIQNVNIFPTKNGEDVDLKIVVDEVENAGGILANLQEIEKLKQKTDFKISDIKITGSSVDLSELVDRAQLKVGDEFILYNAKVLENLIISTGLFNNVETKVQRDAENKTIALEFVVRENPKIRSINITGSTLIDNKKLQEISGLRVGDILNTRLLSLEESPIIKAYIDAGYHWVGFSNVSVTNEGDVNIQVYEGVVSEIVYEKKGIQKENERIEERDYKLKTKPFVLERNTYVKKGKVLNMSELELTLKELFRTGLFSTLSHEVIQGKDNNLILKIVATERATTAISANVSYSTEDSLSGSLKLSDSNFLGREQSFDLTGEAGIKGNYNLSLGFKDPWVKGTDRLLAGFNVSFKKTKVNVTDTDEFKEKNKDKTADAEQIGKEIYTKPTDGQYVLGLNGQIGKGFGPYMYISATPRILNVISNNKGTVKEANRYQDYTLGAIGTDFVIDTRDDKVIPKKGFFADLYVEGGYIFREKSVQFNEKGQPLKAKDNGEAENTAATGADEKVARLKPRAYYTGTLDLRAYYPIVKNRNSMAFRALFNYSHSNTPVGQLASVGDGVTLRGLTNFVGGNKYTATVSVENRTYFNDYLQGVVFYDGGIAEKMKTNDGKLVFKNNVGLGARITTPIGVLRLDYGWDLGNVNSVKQGKFNFGFGQTF